MYFPYEISLLRGTVLRIRSHVSLYHYTYNVQYSTEYLQTRLFSIFYFMWIVEMICFLFFQCAHIYVNNASLFNVMLLCFAWPGQLYWRCVTVFFLYLLMVLMFSALTFTAQPFYIHFDCVNITVQQLLIIPTQTINIL